MKFKDGDSSIDKVGRRRWSILRHSSGESKARREPVLNIPLPGLALRIDNDKNIIELSDKLKQRLSLYSFGAGLPLDELVVQDHAWLALSPGEWPDELPILKMRDARQQALSFTCCVVNEGASWLLLLVDVDLPMASLEQYEHRLSIWHRASDYSVRIQSARGEAGPILADWLEELSRRLGLAWAAVVLYEDQVRIELQHYFNPELTLSAPDLIGLCNLLEKNRPQQPFRSDDFADEYAWCVPYLDASGCQSWLCLGYGRRATLPTRRNIDDLDKVFALIVEPLLLHGREQRSAKAFERYKSFEMFSNGGWWEYYPETDSMCFSRNLLNSLGIEGREEFVEMPATEWLKLIVPADRDELRWKLNGEGHFRHCFRFQVNGGHYWYQVEGVHSKGGDNRYLLGIALDVNDIHSIEKEAEKNQARLMGLVDSAPGIIYLQQYDEGMLTMSFCSGSLQNILGWDLEHFIENSYAYFIHPDDREIYFSQVRLLLNSGSSECQYRIRDINGEYYWVQDEARLIRDDRGMPIEVIGLCLDISQRKHATEQVYRSEERYRALVEDSPAIIFRYTPEMRVTFANNMLYSALTIDMKEVGAIDLCEILPEDHYREFRNRTAEMHGDEACYTSEITVKRRDGQLRWWVIYERGIFDDQGALLEVQAVARDNTELHEARQQILHSAKMATLGKMAAGLAHEINQPLNVIHMAITNLVTSVDTGSVTDAYLVSKLGRIASQVARAEKIVDHMRVFGRQSDIKGQIFNPQLAVDNALSLLELKLHKDDVDVISDIQPLPNIMGHPDRLEQVLINLMVNARAAALEKNQCDGRRPVIHIEAESDSNRVSLRVRDNGGGIAPEIMDRIFDPFFTTKPAGEGTGLGLSISYSIIKQMSGQLLAHNDDLGAVFTIELPVLSA